jgi:hypothetical protein
MSSELGTAPGVFSVVKTGWPIWTLPAEFRLFTSTYWTGKYQARTACVRACQGQTCKIGQAESAAPGRMRHTALPQHFTDIYLNLLGPARGGSLTPS